MKPAGQVLNCQLKMAIADLQDQAVQRLQH